MNLTSRKSNLTLWRRVLFLWKSIYSHLFTIDPQISKTREHLFKISWKFWGVCFEEMFPRYYMNSDIYEIFKKKHQCVTRHGRFQNWFRSRSVRLKIGKSCCIEVADIPIIERTLFSLLSYFKEKRYRNIYY